MVINNILYGRVVIGQQLQITVLNVLVARGTNDYNVHEYKMIKFYLFY